MVYHFSLQIILMLRKGEGRKKPSMYMVFPYMEHDLSGLLENPAVQFSEPQIKCYLMQLLEGLKYLHAVGCLDTTTSGTLPNNFAATHFAS
jgi:serine/threonine protein kinase